MQSIDVVEAVFGDEGPPLDLEKMAALGKEAAVVGWRPSPRRFLLLFSALFFTQSKSPLKEQPVENIDPGVCLSGKCANGAKNVMLPRVHVRPFRRRPQRGAGGKPGAVPRVTIIFVSLR